MRTVVVVPTYNEAGNLARLVEPLLALEPRIDVLCVDDGSPDGTGDVADKIVAEHERFHVIHRTGKRGYSVSSKEGMEWSLARGFEIIATMDADLSHDPNVLPQLISAIEAGADLAIGSRYAPGGQILVDWGPFRRAVSRAGSAYARMMVGTPTRDCTSGYRCYRARALSGISLPAIQSEGYSFLIELLAGLRDQGARIVEVPITYVDRCHGASKISKSIIVEALGRTTAVGLARLTGRRRWAALEAAPR